MSRSLREEGNVQISERVFWNRSFPRNKNKYLYLPYYNFLQSGKNG